MLKFVILLSVIACVWGAAVPEGLLPQVDGRIIGGTTTTISQFPYQLSLQRSGSHSCGATPISSTIVVTAAHCMQKVTISTLSIRAGSSFWNEGGQVVGVAAFKNHEAYKAATMVNDISVIRLKSALKLSATVRTIPLASKEPVNGAEAVVSGWGTTKFGSSSIPKQLQYVNLKIVGRQQCASNSYGYRSAIKASMICAEAPGKDACQGDSGGPLVSAGQLVGVVSWGNACADPNYPGVYADVAALRSWVIATASSV